MAVSDDEIAKAAKHFRDWDFGNLYDLWSLEPEFEEKDKIFQDYLHGLMEHAAKYGAAIVLAEIQQDDGIVILAESDGSCPTNEINVYIDALSFSVSLKELLQHKIQHLPTERVKLLAQLFHQMIDEVESEHSAP